MDRTSPRTPFSTPLSGSARQAEARIRNLFQGPKRRPPVWLMVLALLLILSCGGLVTCQDQKVPPEKAEISALSASATSQPLSSEDLLLVDALYGAAAPQMGTAEDGESIPQLLCAHSQDGTIPGRRSLPERLRLLAGHRGSGTGDQHPTGPGLCGLRTGGGPPISSRSGSTAAVSSACSTPSTPWIRAAAPAPPG